MFTDPLIKFHLIPNYYYISRFHRHFSFINLIVTSGYINNLLLFWVQAEFMILS